MATPMMRIKKVIEEKLRPQGVKLSRMRGGRIYGWVISEAFEGVSEVDRFQKIWKPLDRHLASKDHAQISILFGVTPSEHTKLFEKTPRPSLNNHRYSSHKLAGLMRRARKALAQEYALGEIELRRTDTGRIAGQITSRSFARQDEHKRLDRIRKLLEENLTAEDLEHVGVIWLLTPRERKILIDEED
ncbi:MAG: hypothetical protein AAB354_10275 [candidate division KSB1 bacterium]